jgi:hypothetical protein
MRCGGVALDLMPTQYDERPDPANRTCVAWHQARNAAMESYRAVFELRELVAGKVERAEGRGGR